MGQKAHKLAHPTTIIAATNTSKNNKSRTGLTFDIFIRLQQHTLLSHNKTTTISDSYRAAILQCHLVHERPEEGRNAEHKS